MAARNIVQFLAAAALTPAVAGTDAACPAAGAQGFEESNEETALLQARNAAGWRHKRTPGKPSIAEIGADEPEFDPLEGGDDEAEEEYQEGDVQDVGDGDMCAIHGFTKYFNYDGPLHVKGKMWLRTVKNSRQDFTFRLTGVDPACENGPGDSPQSCGIYLHKGMSCLADAGDHYYNTEMLETNPWLGMTYTAVKSPAGVVYAGGNRVPVLTGLSKHDISGHVIVVHDFKGQRVACTTTRGFFDGHPPSVNVLPSMGVKWARRSRVSGTVELMDKPGRTPSDTGVYLTAKLSGVDDNCDAGAGPNPMSCAMSITKADSCQAKDGYADVYHKDARKTSPWPTVTYAAFAHGGSVEASITHLPINLGLYGGDINGYTFVVRDYDGHQIGCGSIHR